MVSTDGVLVVNSPPIGDSTYSQLQSAAHVSDGPGSENGSQDLIIPVIQAAKSPAKLIEQQQQPQQSQPESHLKDDGEESEESNSKTTIPPDDDDADNSALRHRPLFKRNHETVANQCQASGESNQLRSIMESGANKFGSSIAAELSNLQIIDSAEARHSSLASTNATTSGGGPAVANRSVLAITGLFVNGPQSASTTNGDAADEWVQHNNSVCLADDDDNEGDNRFAIDGRRARRQRDGLSRPESAVINREAEGEIEEGKEAEEEEKRQAKAIEIPLRAGGAPNISKSLCDNDLIVDHLINKKDSMRIRFDDNGDALIQKRNILHRKFYKSVDDELHKKAAASLNSKNQCMTLDRVFKKLREQIRKLMDGGGKGGILMGGMGVFCGKGI